MLNYDAILIFDLIGTFTFSVFGAYLAEKKGYDVFGIFSCATISALGGGTLREVLFNNLPVYFTGYSYWIAIIFGVVFTLLVFDKFEKIHFLMLVVDAVGLITFSFIEANRAMQFGLGLVGVVFCSVITAVGGGVFRDIVLMEKPVIFQKDLYATTSFLFGVGYFLQQKYWHLPWGGVSAYPCNFYLQN